MILKLAVLLFTLSTFSCPAIASDTFQVPVETDEVQFLNLFRVEFLSERFTFEKVDESKNEYKLLYRGRPIENGFAIFQPFSNLQKTISISYPEASTKIHRLKSGNSIGLRIIDGAVVEYGLQVRNG